MLSLTQSNLLGVTRNRVGYLTLSSIPAGITCRVLFIPDSEEALAIVRGALELLTFPYSWEKFGATSPAQSAYAFMDMFDRFCFDEGNCHMIGEVVTWAGISAPSSKWLECDGASYLRTDWPDLFTIIGTTYGASDGSHFNVPDMRSRTVVGVGTGSGLSTYTLGETLGEETHVLTIGELAAHTHTDSGHTHSEIPAVPSVGAAITGVPVPSAVPGVGVTGLGSANISTSGSGDAHNNIQPSIALSYWIVASD